MARDGEAAARAPEHGALPAAALEERTGRPRSDPRRLTESSPAYEIELRQAGVVERVIER
ncbi:hypothetical protein GCM10009838_53830 [Catenulispora subtropica]|uniref:Uncharacterized protein n=1 Tax=Catenulispora subtropica TaxID=450798 RepID=A0ABN2SE49_9ACTN